jgi:hypothetical protein
MIVYTYTTSRWMFKKLVLAGYWWSRPSKKKKERKKLMLMEASGERTLEAGDRDRRK